tara:strand:- start:478 stop:735 length:258 start_codon:yes stop_codon:yes gene_type:complete
VGVGIAVVVVCSLVGVATGVETVSVITGSGAGMTTGSGIVTTGIGVGIGSGVERVSVPLFHLLEGWLINFGECILRFFLPMISSF